MQPAPGAAAARPASGAPLVAGPVGYPATVPFDSTPRPGRRHLLTAGLGALTLPLLGACAQEQPPKPTGTPRVSAAPSSESPAPSGSPKPSGSEEPSAGPTSPSIKVSKDLDAIKVTGKPNTEPKVDVPAPWAVDKTRVKVLDPGKGAEITEDAPVTLQYHGVNARSGDMFDSSWVSNKGEPVTFSLDGVIPGFRKGLVGQRAGSRVLVAIPGKDGYDPQGNPPQIMPGDTLVFVIDIIATVLDGPEGEVVEPRKGLPEVSDDDGAPKITMPKGEPPEDLTVQPLVKGKGAKVAETDTVHLHYRGALWDNGKVVDDNFGKDPEATPLDDSLIPGFTQGIIGQTVGSRVLLVIPPELAYPDGNKTPAVPKGATMVYVVDILFAQPAQ